jgi:hypothetical protein
VKKVLTIVSIVLFCGFIVVLPFLIKVRIDCKSQYGDCPDEINAKLQMLNVKSLYSARKNASKIFKNDFLVSDFSLQYKIPNILHAELLVKKPVAAFGDSTSGSIILVDKDGIALSTASDSALPVVTVTGNLPKIGQYIEDSNLFALNLATGIYQMYQIGESQVQDDSLLVELPGQIRVIFPLEGDTQVLLGSLRLIYSKIQSDGNLSKYSQIDLRFKNPVLR